MCWKCDVFSSDRRSLMRASLGFVAAAAAAPALFGTAARAAGVKTDLTSAQALDKLKEGNARYVRDAQTCVADLAQARERVAAGQAPWASILTCADSRVAPELLFGGLGLGEIFVCRNAGNTADTAVIGTLEYGIVVLGSPLIVVLGHEACGAVKAACDVLTKKASFPGSIGPMLEPIIPAAAAAQAESGDLVDNAVRANARRQAASLASRSQIVADAVAAGKVTVVSAYYGLKDGQVEWQA